MSDDLVKRLTIRLQEIYDRPHDFSNGQKSEAAGLARDRIEELEAKLEKAVNVLDRIQHGSYGKNAAIARTTLAELTSSEAADNEVKGCNDE